jgi:hypothetical protein
VSADSVEVRSGQWGWSLPVDPASISQDSLYLSDPHVVHYWVDGPLLIVDGLFPGSGSDTLAWDGEHYRSNWMYTYGQVLLVRGGNPDCGMHD